MISLPSTFPTLLLVVEALLETCYLTKRVELSVTSQGFKNFHELHNQLASIRNFSCCNDTQSEYKISKPFKFNNHA